MPAKRKKTDEKTEKAEKKEEKPAKSEKVAEKAEKNEELPEPIVAIAPPAQPAPCPEFDRPKKEKIVVKAIFADERVITENCDAAHDFYNQSSFGKILEDGKVQLSLCEGLYLLERGKIAITEKRKKLDFEGYIKKAREVEPNFWIRYCVFKNMRNRGYIIKTALKFGADFRVYDRGVKPGDDHARWIIYPVNEGNTLTWYEFAAKNRVAHSTKKRLMVGIVDDEGDVTYYEIRWMRP